MWFEEFQDGPCSGHLGYRNGMILVILHLCDAFHQVLAQSNLRFGRRYCFEEFQDGRHLGYCNRTILAILNLYVASMPPIKFWLNLTYGLGGDIV